MHGHTDDVVACNVYNCVQTVASAEKAETVRASGIGAAVYDDVSLFFIL